MPYRYFLVLAGLLAAFTGAAQVARTTVKPPLTNVVVYLNGTSLEHQARVTLAAGLNRVVVTGLSPQLNAEALEVQLG